MLTPASLASKHGFLCSTDSTSPSSPGAPTPTPRPWPQALQTGVGLRRGYLPARWWSWAVGTEGANREGIDWRWSRCID